MTLKFENTAEVGDTIRAYDFQPMPGRDDRYVIGTVVAKGIHPVFGFACYTIVAREHSQDFNKPGEHVYVPFQVGGLDYPERVMKCETNCPECGDLVPDYFEHIDRDCTGQHPEQVSAGHLRRLPSEEDLFEARADQATAAEQEMRD